MFAACRKYSMLRTGCELGKVNRVKPRILTANRQRLARLPAAAIRRLAAAWLARLREIAPERAWAELNLTWLDDAGMRELNRRCFGRDRPTDVISLAYPPRPGVTPDGWTGDVAVNVARASQVGPRYGGAARELALYLAHGIHHLSGARDDTPRRRAAMRRVERAWLRAAAREGLLAALQSVMFPAAPRGGGTGKTR